MSPQPEIVPRVKTVATEWTVGADGCLSRQVAGVEVGQQAPEQTTAAAAVIAARSPLPFRYNNSLAAVFGRVLKSLATARTLIEALDVRDGAAGLYALAKIAKDDRLERAATAVRIRAERKVGELCRELSRLQGTRGTGNQARADGRKTKRAQLEAAGVTLQQSKTWEKLAAVPSEAFEAALASIPSLSTRAVLRAAWKPHRNTVATTVDPAALRLWRRLVAFDDGTLDQEPQELLRSLTPAMRERVCELAPRISAWLDRVPPAPHARKRTASVGDQLGRTT